MSFRLLRKRKIVISIVMAFVIISTPFWPAYNSMIRRYLLDGYQIYHPENNLINALNNEVPRKFLYLLQTENCIPNYLKNANAIGNSSFCYCDVLILSFKSSCNGTSPEHVQYVNYPNTTWSTGRNLLYDIAMKRATKYLYYIFMDDDILLRPTWENDRIVNNSWRDFERFLLKYTPPVGITAYCYTNVAPSCIKPNKPTVVRIQGVFDAAFNAFHIKALPYLIPYVTRYENISWWHSQHYLAGFASLNFKREGVVSYEAITALNIKHRDYPQKDPSVEILKSIKEDVIGMVKQKNLPEVVWQGKNVTFAVQERKGCSCYS